MSILLSASTSSKNPVRISKNPLSISRTGKAGTLKVERGRGGKLLEKRKRSSLTESHSYRNAYVSTQT